MQWYLIEYGNHIKIRYLYLLLISDVISNHTGNTSALVIVWMIQVQREGGREREREGG